ncbi:MAG: 3-oxoadipate enol-lactonase [Thermoleophilaceae bacterium]|nr:3-oxoadipate enol-lactonase [Thermoleophilaceae bacterium]
MGDIEIAYREAGEGRPLVLIHGLAQDHGMWAHEQADLSGYRTLALDVRGHGDTATGAADGTLAQLGGDLVAFLEAIGPATCIGFSLGGTIALWAAAERPDLVVGVAAIATSSVVGRQAADGMRERIAIAEEGDRAAMRDLLVRDTHYQLSDGAADAAAIAEQRLRAIGDRTGYTNGLRAMLAMRDEPLNDRLEQISVPVLVVTGEHDAVCPGRAAEIMREHLPSTAEFLEIAGVGHLMTDEAPRAVSGALRGWLEAGDRRG